VNIVGYFHELNLQNSTLVTTNGLTYHLQIFDLVSPHETLFTSHSFLTKLSSRLSITPEIKRGLVASSIEGCLRKIGLFVRPCRKACGFLQSGRREFLQTMRFVFSGFSNKLYPPLPLMRPFSARLRKSYSGCIANTVSKVFLLHTREL